MGTRSMWVTIPSASCGPGGRTSAMRLMAFPPNSTVYEPGFESLERQVDRLGHLTQPLLAGLEEAVERQTEQHEHHRLVHRLVARGERDPEREQRARTGDGE